MFIVKPDYMGKPEFVSFGPDWIVERKISAIPARMADVERLLHRAVSNDYQIRYLRLNDRQVNVKK